MEPLPPDVLPITQPTGTGKQSADPKPGGGLIISSSTIGLLVKGALLP